jgi:putative redox protein
MLILWKESAKIEKAQIGLKHTDMNSEIFVDWKENLHFVANVDGFSIELDSLEENGSKGKGPRPKPLILTALAGCTAMDVISILKKMRLNVKDFKVRAQGRTAPEHPKKYENMTLVYELKGENLPLDQVKKAIILSQERYCGVYATLINSVSIDTEIIINGEKQE